MQSTLDSSSELVKPSRAPDLDPQRQRLLELGLDLWPRLRAPARVPHRAQDAVDAKPRVPEALVGVARFVHFAAPRFTAMRSWALQVRKSVVSGRPILRT